MTTATEYKHGPFKMFSIIFSVFFFLVVMFFSYISMQPLGTQLGIYSNSTLFETGDNDPFYLEISPASWTFSIWGFIYAWQAIWIIYALTTLCRKTETGYLYMHESQMPTGIYWIYMFNNLLNVGWLLLWDRYMVEWSLLVIVGLPLTLYVMIVLTVRALNAGQVSLAEQGMMKEVWFNRFFVQNGLGIYATWVTIATQLNLGIVLTYKLGLEQSVSSTVCLGIVAFLLVVWIILDLIVCDKYTRFMFIPYVVVIVALTGSMHENWVSTKRNSIFTAVLMGVTCAAFIVKIIAMVYRQCKHPIPAPRKEKDYQVDAEAQPTSEKATIF